VTAMTGLGPSLWPQNCKEYMKRFYPKSEPPEAFEIQTTLKKHSLEESVYENHLEIS